MRQSFTKAEVIRERWRRGNLRYKFHAAQIVLDNAFRNLKRQLFVAECARQFGKSFWLVCKETEVCLQKRHARAKLGTAFHTDLIEFIMPAFDTILQDCPKRYLPRFMKQQSKWVFPETGAELKLVGLDRKPNGLRGNAIDIIGVDEAGFVSKLDYLYRSVIIPATTHRPDCKVILASSSPNTPAHPFLDFVQKAEFEGSHSKFTIYDNPMLDEATRQRLMDESGGPLSTTWRREYLCEHCTDDELSIVSGWNPEYEQDVPRDQYYGFYHKYVSMDLGVKDKTAAIFGYYDYAKAKLIIEDEFALHGPTLTTEKIKDAVVDKQNALWGGVTPYRRVSDNNNPLLLQDLSIMHGLHFLATDKGLLEEMVNVVKILVSQGRIIVHPRCTQLIGCLRHGVWDEKRSKFARSKVYGHFDALAALIYLCRNLDVHTNPIPVSYNVDHVNQILFKKANNYGANALRDAFNIKRK